MRIITILLCIALTVLPVSASEITAPQVTGSAAGLMPEEDASFGEGLWEMIQKAISAIRPDIKEAATLCTGMIVIVLLTAIIHSFPGKSEKTADLAGTAAIAVMLLGCTNSMVALGTQTIRELNSYGNLLLPVMTSALAAQGGITGSAALYAGTTMFNTVLTQLIVSFLIPMIYMFLVLATANSAIGEEILKKISNFIKWLMVWCLKIVLYVFTGYMGITGVVSGTTDAATLKAAKLTISGAVPVVGNILSDASEAVLVSAGVVKNTAGIYGIFAVLAIFVSPFLRIGVHYLLMKSTAAVCEMIGSKSVTGLIEDFASTMGLLLAMTGSVCLLLLISTVCFLKGVL